MTIAVILTIVLFAVAGLWWVTKRKPRLEINVAAPEFVAEGHSCEVGIMIVNVSDQVVVLDLLTVDDSLLSRFDLIALTPNAQSTARALGWQGPSVGAAGAIDALSVLARVSMSLPT